jgi:hypothetical protein
MSTGAIGEEGGGFDWVRWAWYGVILWAVLMMLMTCVCDVGSVPALGGADTGRGAAPVAQPQRREQQRHRHAGVRHLVIVIIISLVTLVVASLRRPGTL